MKLLFIRGTPFWSILVYISIIPSPTRIAIGAITMPPVKIKINMTQAPIAIFSIRFIICSTLIIECKYPRVYMRLYDLQNQAEMILHDAIIIRCVGHLNQSTIPVFVITDEQPECIVTPQIALAV